MNPHLADELAALGRLTVAGLRSRYAELFGEPTRTGNKTWLVRRLAWRLQALAEGDLSERARPPGAPPRPPGPPPAARPPPAPPSPGPPRRGACCSEPPPASPPPAPPPPASTRDRPSRSRSWKAASPTGTPSTPPCPPWPKPSPA